MICKIEANKVELFNKSKNNVTAIMEYTILENVEFKQLKEQFKLDGDREIKLEYVGEIDKKDLDYKTDNVFTLKLYDCLINNSVFCNIQIDRVNLNSNLNSENKTLYFTTTAYSYADIKIIE